MTLGVGKDQDDRRVAGQPVIKIALVAEVVEAVVRLAGEESVLRFALDQQGQVQHGTAVGVDQIDVSVDAVIDAPGMEEVAHLQAASFDQGDAFLTDERLARHRLAISHRLILLAGHDPSASSRPRCSFRVCGTTDSQTDAPPHPCSQPRLPAPQLRPHFWEAVHDRQPLDCPS